MRVFTQEPIEKYTPLLTNKGDVFSFKILTDLGKGMYIASSSSIKDRTDAENIKNLELFIKKDQLPKTKEDEFYYVDLVGCTVIADNQEIGEVLSVNDFGAGVFLDIKVDTKIATIPFNQESIVSVDIENKKIVVLKEYIFL